jgi:hypothetical protein
VVVVVWSIVVNDCESERDGFNVELGKGIGAFVDTVAQSEGFFSLLPGFIYLFMILKYK